MPSPAWKTFATRMPNSSCSRSIPASTRGSAVRGTTPSCTMYAGLIRPTAANADLRPFQMAARSSAEAATRISKAPLSRQIRSTAANWCSTSARGPSSSTTSTAPAPAG